MNKTSKADFSYFTRRCRAYLNQLNLGDWKPIFEHEDHPDAYAWIKPDSESKQTQIGLSVHWDTTKVTKEMLDYCARHEVLHLLLADLVAVGKWRQSTDTDFTTAQHAVIRRLENMWN